MTTTYTVLESIYDMWKKKTQKPVRTQFGLEYPSMPGCSICGLEFQVGDRVKGNMHLECWKKKVAEWKAALPALQEKRRREREERRQLRRLQNKDPPGSFRLSAWFLMAFRQRHGYPMRCPMCCTPFHPGSLVVSQMIGGSRRLVDYGCRQIQTQTEKVIIFSCRAESQH